MGIVLSQFVLAVGVTALVLITLRGLGLFERRLLSKRKSEDTE
jgi:hypothetical protein